MKPKRPKPGFKNFIKTRMRHPLMSHDGLVYVGVSGERFRDAGSVQTFLLPAFMIFLLIATIITVDYTLFGLMMWILLFIMHRYLRYFWTEFLRVDEEGNIIEDEGRTTKGNKRSNNEYKAWQKALFALEALLILAAVAGVTAITLSPAFAVEYPPISLYEIKNPEGMTFAQIYSEVKKAAEDRFPRAEPVNYGVSNFRGYSFLFRNPNRGLVIHNIVEMTEALVYFGSESTMVVWRDNTHIPLRWVFQQTLSSPPESLDFRNMLEIVLHKAGLSENDVKNLTIEACSSDWNANHITDPGGNTWAVEFAVNGTQYYYTVNLAEGTAIKEY